MPKNKLQSSREIRNRDALRDYFISDTFEAGIMLEGAEVKSIRLGQASFNGAYAAVERNCVRLYGLRIEPYKFAPESAAIDPLREKKLLLKSREVERLQMATQAQGLTLVPLKLYFKGALVKVELGLGQGKKKFDKRAELREKAVERESERFFKYKK
jgi:SsrA-binding protein